MLEESVYYRRRRQVTQLLTYLLTRKLFSSCILGIRKTWKFCEQFMPLKTTPLKLSLLRESRPKSTRASPRIWLTLFHISSKSVHFRRSYYRTIEDRFCPVECLQYRLFEPITSNTGVQEVFTNLNCTYSDSNFTVDWLSRRECHMSGGLSTGSICRDARNVYPVSKVPENPIWETIQQS